MPFPATIQEIRNYGIFALDVEGNITSWNKGSSMLQGYPSEEVMGQPFARLYEMQISKPAGYFNELLAKARELGFLEEEGWRQRKDKSYFWSTLAITPIYDPAKKLMAYSLVSKDLTAKKIASELSEITESESRTSVLATSNVVWYRSKEGEFIYPELQWEHFTGQPWPEHQGFGWLSMYPEEERSKVKAFWDGLQTLDVSKAHKNWHALESPELIRSLTLRTKLWSKLHKEYRPVCMSVVPVFTQAGEVEHWVGNEKDEHNVVAEKSRYKQLSEKQQLILKTSKVGLWEYDIKTKRLAIDAVIAEFYKVAPSSFNFLLDEVRGKIHPEDAGRMRKMLQDCIEYGKSYHAKFRVSRLDGSICHIVEDGTAQFDEYGKIKSILGSNWDITETYELIEVSARALQAEKQRKQQKMFTDTICHEMRNPLNGISGHANQLREAFAELEKVRCLDEDSTKLLEAQKQQLRESIDTILDCSRHQEEVINQALEFSHISESAPTLSYEDFSLQAICRSLITTHQAELSAKPLVGLSLTLPEQEFWVKSDVTRFRQTLVNVLSYVINATARGQIDIELYVLTQSADKTQFRLSIADSGLALTSEQLNNLFEPFTAYSRRSFEGQYEGLRLAISNELIKLLGGSITVESLPGGGIIFKLLCEFEKGMAPEVASDHAPSALIIASSRSVNLEKTILVVDDDKTNRKLLERLLNKLGCQCILAEQGDQGVEAYQEYKPDLILMDIEMPPGIDGFDTTKTIRRLETGEEKVPIYAVTAYGSDEYKARATAAGMDGLITKPIDMKKLKDLICLVFGLAVPTPFADLATPVMAGAGKSASYTTPTPS